MVLGRMRVEWARSIRDQCRASGVPFFFKQWGGVRKKETGRSLDGRTYIEFPVHVALPLPDNEERLLALREMEAAH